MTKREEMLLKRISELKRERDEMKKKLKAICGHLISGEGKYYGVKYIEMGPIFKTDKDFAAISKAVEEYK